MVESIPRLQESRFRTLTPHTHILSEPDMNGRCLRFREGGSTENFDTISTLLPMGSRSFPLMIRIDCVYRPEKSTWGNGARGLT